MNSTRSTLRYPPAILCLVATLAVLLMGQTSRSPAGEGEVIQCQPIADGLKEVQLDRNGELYAQLADGHFAKFNAHSQQIWKFRLDDLEEVQPISPVSFTIDPKTRNALVLGLTLDPSDRTLMIYEVDTENPFGGVEVWGSYPGMEPVGITTSPQGTIYLLALSAQKINEAMRDPLKLQEFDDFLIHELDQSGDIVRSLRRLPRGIKSRDELRRVVSEHLTKQLVFSPAGTPYLRDFYVPKLERVDLNSAGETVGVVHLATSGLPVRMGLPYVGFVSETELVYTTLDMGPNNQGNSRIRSMDLSSGVSRPLLASQDENQTLGAFANPVSGAIVLLNLVGDERGSRVAEIGLEEFRNRLRREH